MKNCITRVASVVLCMLLLLQPLCSFAAENTAPQKCKLTILYTKNDLTFSDFEINIYRVAKRTGESSFKKVSPFNQYPVNVTNVSSQMEWKEIAETFLGYVNADNIEPYMSKTVDEKGEAVFENLEEGLYLVSGTTIQAGDVIYDFHEFMICLPTIKDGTYTYDVSAIPKSSQSEPISKEITYTILKLWKDEGHSEQRPDSITVDILKSGETQETILLNASNNWTYSFTCTDGNDDWSVVERNVPEGYSVTVTEKETSFVVMNTWEEPLGDPEIPVEPDGSEDPDEPEQPTDIPSTKPQTGDIAPLKLWMTTFCLSGLVLIVLGVGMRRKENAF